MNLADTRNIHAVNVVYEYSRPPSVDLYVHPRTTKLIASRRLGLPTPLSEIEYGAQMPASKPLEAPTADQFAQYVGEWLWCGSNRAVVRDGALWDQPTSLDHFYDRLRSLTADQFAELRVEFVPGAQHFNLRRTRTNGAEDTIYLNSLRGRLSANGSLGVRDGQYHRDDVFSAEYNNFEHAARDIAKRLFGRNNAQGSEGRTS
jgi:hypothetical protein